MSSESTAVLLVEDDTGYARLIAAALRRSRGRHYELVHVEYLSDALVEIKQRTFDAVLLDLTLPDARGLETFTRLHRADPELPIVVLSGLDDEQVALSAVQNGAQDYLVKGHTDTRALAQAIAYAIERQRLQADRNRQSTRLAILRDVDEELTRHLDLDYVLTMALDTAVRLSVASAGLIGLLQDEHLRLVKDINYALSALTDEEILTRGVVGRALRERKAQRVLDVSADPDYLPLLPHTRAQIAIPLLSQDRLVGFLNLETTDPNRFSEETFDFLKLLAARIATAVDNARLYEKSRSQLAELQQLYNQVRNLEQMKTDMIRIATHDLRAPLNNIIGFVYLLRRELDPATHQQALDYLDYIERSTERMQKITTDILSLERLGESGALRTERLDLQTLAEQVFREYQEQARRKDQRLELALSPQPVMVQGEPSLLYEAISNLVGNAIKYTPSGGAVQVHVYANGGKACLEIIDTGYGIPEDQQKRLFEPFFRAKSSESTGAEGSGLGLHLVRNIIIRHDGEVLFSSVYGQGSTFGFTLPLA